MSFRPASAWLAFALLVVLFPTQAHADPLGIFNTRVMLAGVGSGSSAAATVFSCDGTDQTTAIQSLLSVNGHYTFVPAVGAAGGVCKFNAISETGVTLILDAAQGMTFEPATEIDTHLKFTSSNVTINNVNFNGEGLAQVALWASTGTSLQTNNVNLTNYGYPVDHATAIVADYRIDGATGFTIVGGSTGGNHSVGNGTCGDALGELRNIYVANSGAGVIAYHYFGPNDGNEDDDLFHAVSVTSHPNVGGTILAPIARYNELTRRVFKFQSGDWTVEDADVRPDSTFTPVSGQSIGMNNLNMVDKAGSDVGDVVVKGGFFDATGFPVGISNSISAIGGVQVIGVNLKGAQAQQSRASFSCSNPVLTNYDTVGYSSGAFPGSINGITASRIFGFGRAIVLGGSGSYATNNVIDDPLTEAAEIGVSGQVGNEITFTNNRVITRTSGFLSTATQIIRVFNNTANHIFNNSLEEAGNTTHGTTFIKFTDSSATGTDVHDNYTPSGTTAVNSSAAAGVYDMGENGLPPGPNAVSTLATTASSTTLSAINAMTVNVQAGKTYYVRLWLPFTADTTGGHRYSLGGGTATTTAVVVDYRSFCTATGAIILSSRQTSIAGTAGENASTCTAGTTLVEGTIIVNAAGTFIPQFSQQSANGSSSILARATLTMTRLN